MADPVDALPKARITVFRSTDALRQRLSKHITLSAEGKPVSKIGSNLHTGEARVIEVPDATSLATVFNHFAISDMATLGVIKGAANGTVYQVVTADALTEPAKANGTIARTKEFLEHAPGQEWVMFDYDPEFLNDRIKAAVAADGGAFALICKIAPGFAAAERVHRPSTSAGLYRDDTGERFPDKAGTHDHVLVQDGTDVERMMLALKDHAWLHDLACHAIGEVGQIIERTIFDLVIRFAHQPDFEANPKVDPPLKQDLALRRCQVFVGVAIDTRSVVPDLTPDQRRIVDAKKAASRAALEPEARRIRATVDKDLAAKIATRTGKPLVSAQRDVAAWRRGVVTPDMVFISDHKGEIPFRDVLLNPSAFFGVTGCCPYAGPTYRGDGRGRAMIMQSAFNPSRGFTNSYAHGGATFDIHHDLESAKAFLDKAAVKTIADTLCDVVDHAELEPDERDQLIEHVVALAKAEKLKLGKRELNRRVTQDSERRARERRRIANEKREAAEQDHRTRRLAPLEDDEVGPVVRDIDEVLSEDTSDLPPMRRPDGNLVVMRIERPFDLHQLAATGANAEPDEKPLPAPAEPTLRPMTAVTVGMLIGDHMVFRKVSKNGVRNVALKPPFVQAFMQLPPEISKLPIVRAICPAPMIAENGTVIDGNGLDRDTGVLYVIEPGLRDCLPQGEITEADVREATQWLLDEWLIDVLCTTEHKLIVISVALTIIERLLLKERPAFNISAPSWGTGKTTLAHMIFMAVLGRMAAATAYSTSQEERRKALFSYFRQGVAALVIDNIENGAEIDCPEIAKALTSSSIQDRILQVSEFGTAMAHAVLIFTGNNTKFVGDLASRVPEIRLTTDLPNPTKRPVVHAEPNEWTQNNRAKILACLYTVLIFGNRNRPADQIAKTRFKAWWRLIGYPVEKAASLLQKPLTLDFNWIFEASVTADTKQVNAAAALRQLQRQFGDQWFRSRDIRALIEKGERARRHMVDLPAVELANQHIEMVTELMGKRNPSPLAAVIGRALGRIKDKPVDLDETTRGALRTKLLHGDNWFCVEISKKRDDGIYEASLPPADPQPDEQAEDTTKTTIAPDNGVFADPNV